MGFSMVLEDSYKEIWQTAFRLSGMFSREFNPESGTVVDGLKKAYFQKVSTYLVFLKDYVESTIQ